QRLRHAFQRTVPYSVIVWPTDGRATPAARYCGVISAASPLALPRCSTTSPSLDVNSAATAARTHTARPAPSLPAATSAAATSTVHATVGTHTPALQRSLRRQSPPVAQ